MNTKKIAVVKFGSSVVTTKRGRLDLFQMSQVAKQIKILHEYGVGIVLVISGAVTCGMGVCNKSFASTEEKSLFAGIGQVHIISQLQSVFEKAGMQICQLLLTKNDLSEKQAKKKLIQTMHLAYKNNIVLIANENDIVELNSFGGNDYLALDIASLVMANYLVLLTSVEGVYDKDMHVIKELSNYRSIASLENTSTGIGGMQTKIIAAKSAAKKGIHTTIANGQTKDILTRVLLNNEKIGTQVI